MTGASSERPRISLRAAIDAKCKECIYDPYGGTGTWRQQVAACTSPTCPLFPIRPMPTIRKGKNNPVRAEFSTEKRRTPYSLYPPMGPGHDAGEKECFGA